MGNPRKWASNAERQAAYRLRRDLKQGKIPATQASGFQEARQHYTQEVGTRDHAEKVDTTGWSWQKWAQTFLGINLQQFQILALEQLATRLRIILNIPRRHGKTTIVLRAFVTRMLCETAIRKDDTNLIFISANKDNITDFVLMIAYDLMDNEQIINNYGYLLDEPSKQEIVRVRKIKRKQRRNTQLALNLGNRKDIFNHSLLGTTVQGGIRGKGADYVLVDDPVELFHGYETARKQTKKIMAYLKEKIYPIAERTIAVVGTRYDLDGYDIFSLLGREHGGKVWKHITQRAISVFGSYTIRDTTDELTPADIIINSPDEWELLSPFIWELRAAALEPLGIRCSGLQLIAYLYETTERAYFMKEWQNQPMQLEALIDVSKFNTYNHPRPISRQGRWVIFVDIAVSESKGDRTSMVLVGKDPKVRKYFIQDYKIGRWAAVEKYKIIYDFYQEACKAVGFQVLLLIEVVRNQAEAYQFIRDTYHDVNLRQVNPKGRGTGDRKDAVEWRIVNNFIIELELGNLFLSEVCRQRKEFLDECLEFPFSHPDGLDAADQAVFYLKTTMSSKIKFGWLNE